MCTKHNGMSADQHAPRKGSGMSVFSLSTAERADRRPRSADELRKAAKELEAERRHKYGELQYDTMR